MIVLLFVLLLWMPWFRWLDGWMVLADRRCNDMIEDEIIAFFYYIKILFFFTIFSD